MFVTY